MFEMGRELKKLFAADAPDATFAHGDGELLELLDVRLLRREAREADIAAGRVGAIDRPQRLLEGAVVWREIARRTGDAAALRKAASAAEAATKGFTEAGRHRRAEGARMEQAACAMLGAELFAEDGLDAAAEYVLADLSKASAEARGGLARLSARRALASGGLAEALAAAARFDKPLAALAAAKDPAARGMRQARAEVLNAFGARLHDPLLFKMALNDLDEALAGVEADYRPLTFVRLQETRGLALVGLAEAHGDATPLIEAVELLTAAAGVLPADHSPLDWARLHHTLGLALMALAESADCDAAFDKALDQFDDALAALDGCPLLALKAAVAQNRATCMARRAEAQGDVLALDEAEAAFRCELGNLPRPVDPTAWALLQVSLGRLYLARALIKGGSCRNSERAGEALTAALEVFGEAGRRSLAAIAQRELERLGTLAKRTVR